MCSYALDVVSFLLCETRLRRCAFLLLFSLLLVFPFRFAAKKCVGEINKKIFDPKPQSSPGTVYDKSLPACLLLQFGVFLGRNKDTSKHSAG